MQHHFEIELLPVESGQPVPVLAVESLDILWI